MTRYYDESSARSLRLVSRKGEKSTLSNTISGTYTTKHLLGYGFNILTGDVASNALDPFELVPNDLPRSDISIRSVKDEHEMKQELSMSVKGDFSLEGADIGFASKFILDIEASALSLSLIAEFSSEDNGFSVAPATSYKLMADAKQYFEQNGEKAFQETYGHYFIAGHRMGSHFYAVYQCSATDMETFVKFKQSLSASVPDLFDGDAAAKFKLLISSLNIKLNIEIHHTPTTEKPPKIEVQNPEEVIEFLNWFRKHQKREPIETLFMSYSNVLRNYSNKISIEPELVSRIRLLYEDFWMVQYLYKCIPSFYKESRRAVYDELISDIQAHRSRFMTSEKLTNKYYSEAESLIDDFRNILQLEALYYNVQRSLASRSEPAKGEKVKESNIDVKSYGITLFDFATEQYVKAEEAFPEAPWRPAQWMEARFKWENGNRIILGWRVESRQLDNGYWVKESEQATLGQELRLYFCSNLWGFGSLSYKVIVYSIDKGLFRFGSLAAAQDNNPAQAAIA